MSRLHLVDIHTINLVLTRGEGAILLPDVGGSAEGEAVALGVVKVNVNLEASVRKGYSIKVY